MAAQRRPPRSVAEAKAPRRDLDLNKERLIFCLSNLIGHKVTAKLRGNVTYEGVFHSCALEGDFSIILKHARLLPTENQRSGNVIDTLIIPGKDFLQVNAMDIATLDSEEETGRVGGGAFATDGEISGKRPVGEENRELVAWSPGGDDAALEVGGLDTRGGNTNWDQFEVNEKKFGVASTFNEEYYTTKLDPSAISAEKREMADRIAKEIESEAKHNDSEDHHVDGDDDDEEARYSAVQGTGAYAKGGKGASSLTGSSSAAPSSKARGSPPGRGESESLTLPVPKAGTEQVDTFSGLRNSYAKQRGMVLTHSPMHSSMISEMKRINALNLEPAVPKLDDKTGSDWINFKQSQQSRNKSNPIQGDGLKHDFQQALADFKKKDAEKKNKELAASPTAESDQSRKPEAGNTGSESTRSSSFKFNPNASAFSFNPSATAFTPGMTPTNANQSGTPSAAMGGQGPNSHGGVTPQNQTKIAMGPGPQFNPVTTNIEYLKKKLDDILDGFFENSCTREDQFRQEPQWTDATGPSFKDILGPPNPALPMQMPMANFGNAQTAPWSQPQMGGQMPGGPGGPPPGPGAPQMMTQPGPFMMPQPGPGGQAQQMQFTGPMYPAPTGAPMQRPPGGNMPPQGQQPMAFNQGGMVQQPGPGGPQMPMHQGNPNQSVNMQNMPKHMPGNMGMPGMVMMVPAGQVPQGFPVQMQGQPGQPMQGQPGPGPQGGNPQGGSMMRPMYMAPGQMGGQMGGGPPHQMPSHDG